ncbi:hypothetical protein F5882DRAFT_311739, partial [Hyaloscypha sp. PMI_1271]
NIFTTSRFIPSIKKEFKRGILLEIYTRDEDIRRYLDGYMSRLLLFVSRSVSLRDEI